VAAVRNVRDLLARRWGVTFTSRESRVTVGSGTRTVLFNHNPTRVAAILVNNGSFVAILAPQGSGFEGEGLRLDPAGGSLTLLWEEDGELTGREWVAFGVGGASVVNVYEILIESAGPERTEGVP